MPDGWEGNCGPGGKWWQPTAGFMICVCVAVGLVGGGGSPPPGPWLCMLSPAGWLPRVQPLTLDYKYGKPLPFYNTKTFLVHALQDRTIGNNLLPALRAPELSHKAFVRASKTHLFSTARHLRHFLRNSGAEYKCTTHRTHLPQIGTVSTHYTDISYALVVINDLQIYERLQISFERSSQTRRVSVQLAVSKRQLN